jgi:hypothetical protein
VPLPQDTSPEFQRVVADAYRRMPLSRKWHMLGETFNTARGLHAAGMLLREPAASPQRIRFNWLASTFGYRGRENSGSDTMSGSNQNLSVLVEVMGVLTNLGISHALGGSMASSLHGVARFTRDADIIVDPFPGKEEAFAAAFGQDYYLSLPAIRQAVAQRASFNVLQTLEGFKVDLFVRKDQPFEESALKRRIMLSLPDSSGQSLAVLTAEDVVLFKLDWFRLGDEVSTQQWSDVLGVLRVQSGHLDETYLDQWAAALNLADLLARVRREV